MPNSPATISAWTRLAPVTLRVAEDAQRYERVRGPRLADDEPDQQRHRDRTEPERLGGAPAVPAAPTIVYTRASARR